MVRYILLFFVLFSIELSAKVRFLIFHYNRPDLIELQYKTFKKFIADDYEMIVFNDADTPKRAQPIQEMCDRYGIACIRYEQEWHAKDPLNQQLFDWLSDPKNKRPDNLSVSATSLESIATHASVRHCHVIQFALDNFGYQHDDIVAIVDADVMPIRPICLRDILKDAPLMGIHHLWWHDRVSYLWVPFIAFDPTRLPDLHDLRFHVDVINNKLYDSGAHTYHYLKNHPNLPVKKYTVNSQIEHQKLSMAQLKQIGYSEAEAILINSIPWPNVEFHIDFHFIHIGASSFGQEHFNLKLSKTMEFFEKIL